jgi:hypothetical protein
MKWVGSPEIACPSLSCPYSTRVTWPEDLHETGILPTDPTKDGKGIPEYKRW